jgi:hypothetical protein
MSKVFRFLGNVLPFVALGLMGVLAFIGMLTLVAAPHLRCMVTP